VKAAAKKETIAQTKAPAPAKPAVKAETKAQPKAATKPVAKAPVVEPKPAVKAKAEPAKAEPAKAEAPKVKTVAPKAVEPVAEKAPALKVVEPAPAAPVAAKAPAPAPAKPVAKPAAKVEERAAPKASGAHRTGFRAQEFIVYPAHGVGQILAIEEQEVAGFKLELFVISFAKDKMTLKVPLPKVLSGAIRKLSDGDTVKKSLDTLTGRARVKRTMWSRRAQEYEAKINSGDLIAIAEVVRDLYRSEAQPEQSYSERQLYEAALDRMARELAAVQKLTEIESLKLVEQHLERGPKRGPRGETPADGDGAEGADGEIEAAA
jgi:CarD family transcriptional regulator